VKAVAAKLRLSTALVYKWCQECPSPVDPHNSGTINPLDRLRSIVEVTGDARVVNWLCGAAGGFFVSNPEIIVRDLGGGLLLTTQRVVQDFGDLLTKVSQSIENDGQITLDEADNIRQSWERLKSQAETFVVACERGMYQRAGAQRP
jgi:hypothetical protein